MKKVILKKIIFSFIGLLSSIFILSSPLFADTTTFNAWITQDITYGSTGATGIITFNWNPVPGVTHYQFARNGVVVFGADSTTGQALYGTTTSMSMSEFWPLWWKMEGEVYGYTWQVIAQLPSGPIVYSNFITPPSNYFVAYDPLRRVPLEKIRTVGEPINVTNGNVVISKTDILIPDIEIPFELSRTYNSQDLFTGEFGYGWRSNFDVILIPAPDSPATLSVGSVAEEDEHGIYTLYSMNSNGTYATSAGKYSVLTKNPDGSYLLTRKHGRKLYFNTQGRLIKIEGRNGNAVNITRSANGSISCVTAPSGRTLNFTQDSQGRIIQVTDPAGRIFKYDYDSAGNLIRVTDPLNNQTTYQYNNYHNLTTETDANNHTLNFEYDVFGRAIHSWQDGNNNEVTLAYNIPYGFTTVTDSLRHSTLYGYFLSTGLVFVITDNIYYSNAQSFDWDSNLNKTYAVDQNGNATKFSYDTRGNLLSIKAINDPLNEITTFTYEPNFDFISSTTDAQGNISKYLYDQKGNLIQFTDAFNNSMNYFYDNLGQLAMTTNPKNFSTMFTYDAYGNLASTTDALNHTTTFTYDILGNRTQTQDAKNNLTQFTYNSLNQLTKITYPDNSTVSYTYDPLGNKISVTDNAQNTTTYTYDLNNHVTSITNPLGKTINFGYDTEGNRTSVTDQNQHTTTYKYDSFYRLISETNPLGMVKTYAYDKVGNRTSVTDANNNKITYAYDTLNRLTNITYPDTASVNFSYDSLGRRISMTDAIGITNYTYDVLGHLTQVNGPGQNSSLQYTYDSLGNRTTLTLPGAKSVQYAYDALNRISSITDYNNKVTTYSYDEVGNPVAILYPNNIQANYTFDPLHRLTHLANQNQSTLNKLSEFSYTYDSAGRRSHVALADGVIDYQYDSLGQLTSEVKTSTNNPYQITYEYDPSGNRTRMVKNGIEYLYTYNNANQLTEESINGPATLLITVTGTVSDASGIQSLSVNGVNATLEGSNFTCLINLSPNANTLTVTATDLAGNTATKSINVTYDQTNQTFYFYDNNGNLIKKQSSNQALFGYDYENRLTSVNSGTINTTYSYNGEGKRISANSNSNITNYLYDGLDVVLEQDALGYPITSYLRNPTAIGGIGGIINSQQGSTPENYYSYDGLGSVANLSDTTGANIQSYFYDAFGNLITQPTISNTHRFLIKETDPSGLIYFGARYYDSNIGRFITQDPLGMIDGPNQYLYVDSVGKPIATDLNLYLYADNDPVNFVDPYGLWYIDINVSAGFWGGGTGGIIIGPEGVYSYGGGGAMSSPGFSVTWSPDDPSPGWNVGFQGGYLGGFQTGYAFGKNGKGKGPFTEFGFVTPGVSLTGYYVSEPWKWPWRRDKGKENKCKK